MTDSLTLHLHSRSVLSKETRQIAPQKKKLTNEALRSRRRCCCPAHCLGQRYVHTSELYTTSQNVFIALKTLISFCALVIYCRHGASWGALLSSERRFQRVVHVHAQVRKHVLIGELRQRRWQVSRLLTCSLLVHLEYMLAGRSRGAWDW